MTPSDDYQGDETREKRPTFLKGIIFLVILCMAAAGLMYAATQLRSAEGPKVASVTPDPLTVSGSMRRSAGSLKPAARASSDFQAVAELI